MAIVTHTVERTARLDQIAKLIYQTEKGGVVEALLAANPGLAGIAGAVPRGTVIAVPDRPAVTTTGYTRPWE
jgi:phage tail protein X